MRAIGRALRLALAFACTAFATGAAAEDYPIRPVRLIVGLRPAARPTSWRA